MEYMTLQQQEAEMRKQDHAARAKKVNDDPRGPHPR
jgi:hypothetical protein